MRITILHIASMALLPAASSLQIPDFQPFLTALPQALQDFLPMPLSNSSAHDVLKRQLSNTCPSGYNSCQNLGAPNLCCSNRASCSPDAAGNVACCPSGAVCTGIISGVITGGTIGSDGQLESSTTGIAGQSTTNFQYPTTTGNGLVQASTQPTAGQGTATGNGGFIINSGSTVASPGSGTRGVQPVSDLIKRGMQRKY